MQTSLILISLFFFDGNFCQIFNLFSKPDISTGSTATSNADSVQKLYDGIHSAFNDILTIDPIGQEVFPERYYVPKLITDANYPVEIHHVTTEDGYILELHRIPHGRLQINNWSHARPILLNHCLLCSSSTFTAPGPDRGLGYLLADRGYDVWMMNDRGNTYSRNHTFLSPEEKKFWLFSIDEIGDYDLPATINYILRTTKWEQIDYLGISMGTTTFSMLMSDKPHYNKMIRKAALLAPVLSGHYAKGPFVRMTHLSKRFEGIAKRFNMTEEIPPPLFRVNDFFLRSCNPSNAHLEDMCDTAFYSLEGANLKGISKERKAQFFRSFPNRGSIRQLKHFSQIFKNGYFRRYSFGRRGNIRRYGQSMPPIYDFKKITAPVAIFWSPFDKFESYRDLKMFASSIQNLQLFHRIPYKNFVHTNFIWDDNVYRKLHRSVLEYLLSPLPSEISLFRSTVNLLSMESDDDR